MFFDSYGSSGEHSGARMEVRLQKSINQSINNPKQSPATVFHKELRLLWNLSTSVQIITEDSELQGNVN